MENIEFLTVNVRFNILDRLSRAPLSPMYV